MDIELIEKLMVAMNTHQIHLVEIKEGEMELVLEKKAAPVAPVMTMTPPVHSEPVSSTASSTKEPVVGTYVTSPIVGTFYAASSPDTPPFIKLGDRISPDTVVCIVEAMKVMNEVKAGVSGIIAEVLLKNGDPVEFGTKIFKVS